MDETNKKSVLFQKEKCFEVNIDQVFSDVFKI